MGNWTQPNNFAGMKYSTDEQIVGEWIDGKPIYQKSYAFNNTSSHEFGFSVADLHLDRLIRTDFSCNNTSGDKVACSYYYRDIDYLNAFYNHLNDTIVIRRGAEHVITTDGYITIQYTKTTDIVPTA